jgi:hypothetical protein
VLGDRFGPIVAQRSTADRHALGHALLAALGCTEAATTNYDQCFELAAAGAGTAQRVMPWEIPHGRAPWLLKLNGDVGHPQSIVLARRDFLRHEALARPSASVLESMMMTRHLLIVGASLTDDNVLRLTHEVAGFRAEHGSEQQPFGTVLDVEASGARQQLWTGELNWLVMPGTDLPERARTLDIFLDALAAQAGTDASWVLDERFEALLEEGDTDTARRTRASGGRSRTANRGMASAPRWPGTDSPEPGRRPVRPSSSAAPPRAGRRRGRPRSRPRRTGRSGGRPHGRPDRAAGLRSRSRPARSR